MILPIPSSIMFTIAAYTSIRRDCHFCKGSFSQAGMDTPRSVNTVLPGRIPNFFNFSNLRVRILSQPLSYIPLFLLIADSGA